MRYSWLKILLPLYCIVAVCTTVVAQTADSRVTIDGVVTSTDNTPLDYVTIHLIGTHYGCLTDAKGEFRLEAPRGAYLLMVSSIGYEKQEIPVIINDQGISLSVQLEEAEHMLDEVVVTAKTDSRLEREEGFALSTVDTKKAMLSTLQTSELLNRTSGVKLRQSGGAGSDIQYNINGLSGNSIRIFIDGIPMENYGNSFSISSLPPSLIEKIDVYKGVVPAHLTDDALGGAINIVLKQPASKSLSTSYTYGSFNTHKWDFNGNYRNSNNGFTVQASAFFNHSDNNYKVWGDPIKVTDPQNGKVSKITAERFHDAYQSKGITLNTGFVKVRWADKFLVGAVYSDMDKEIQHGATMDVVYGNRRSKQHTIMGKVLYEKQNIVRNLDISSNVTLARGNRQVIDTIPYMYNWLGQIMTDREGNPLKWNKGGGEAGKATLATNIETTIAGRARVAYHIVPAHTIAANVLFSGFTRDINDPYLTEAEQQFTEARRLHKTILSLDYSGKFLDERLQTNAFYKFYMQGVQLTDPVMNNGVLEASKIARSISDHGFGATLSYSLGSRVILTSSAEYAVRLPGVTELLGNTTNNIQSSYDLRPEKSINVNIGAIIGAFRFERHSLESDINLFFRDVTDMIQKSLTNPTDEMYGYENLGKVRSMGVDAVVKYNFHNRLFSELNLSYTDARFNLRYDQHGTEYIYYKDRLRNTPYFTTNWSVEYVAYGRLGKESRLAFSYNMGYVHQFYRNWESLGGAGKAVIPSQLVHDIGITYSFLKRQLSLSFDVKNLFNEQVFDNWALQRPGRMFLVKLSYAISK